MHCNMISLLSSQATIHLVVYCDGVFLAAIDFLTASRMLHAEILRIEKGRGLV